MGAVAPKYIQSIFEAFLVGQELQSVTPMQQGFINDSFLLQTPKGAFILQRLNSHVFKAPLALMENLIRFQKLPKPSSYQGPLFLQDKTGNYLHKDPQDGLWRLQEFVPNSQAFDLAPNSKIAKQAGALLANFHFLSQGENLKNYHSPLPGFQDVFLRLDQFSLAFKKADATLTKTAAANLQIIEKLLGFVTHTPTNLPQRLCHNDTKLNNMLFHQKDETALCLIDLDTLMPGYAFYDFGDAFRTIANTAKEGDINTQIVFRKELAQAFVSGLATKKSAYSQSEWQSFALGAVYMPFIHGLRALTDYLEGNRYYKVSYAAENLDRSLSLLQFAEQAYEHQDFIQACLKNHWTG